MSFKQVLCEKEHRDALCQGIKSSIHAIGLDSIVLNQIDHVLDSGSPAQKNYMILFAIVRLSGLYEMIAPKSSERARKLLDSLYQDLNDHISELSSVSSYHHRFLTFSSSGKPWTHKCL